MQTQSQAAGKQEKQKNEKFLASDTKELNDTVYE
jgi:hypothetical protein